MLGIKPGAAEREASNSWIILRCRACLTIFCYVLNALPGGCIMGGEGDLSPIAL